LAVIGQTESLLFAKVCWRIGGSGPSAVCRSTP